MLKSNAGGEMNSLLRKKDVQVMCIFCILYSSRNLSAHEDHVSELGTKLRERSRSPYSTSSAWGRRISDRLITKTFEGFYEQRLRYTFW